MVLIRILYKAIRFVFLPILLSLYLLSGFCEPHSKIVEINHQTSKLKLADYVTLFEDETGQLSINQVSSNDFRNRFLPCKKGICSMGYKKAVYWVKLSTKNLDDNEKWILENDSERIGKSIELYLPNGEKNFDVKTFDSRKIQNDDIQLYNQTAFIITLKKHELQTIYLRIENRTRLNLELVLWSPSLFKQKILNENIFFGILLGFVLVLIIYNLSLFISFQDFSYLFYILLVFSFGLYILFDKSIILRIFPSLGGFSGKIYIWLVVFVCIALILFTRSFLRLRENMPYFNVLSFILIGFLFNSVLLFLWTDSLIWITVRGISCGLTVLFVLISAVVSYIKGYQLALYFLFAMSTTLLLSQFALLLSFSVLPESFLTSYGIEIGFAITALLFSILLAHRVNTTRLEKESAQRETIEVYKKTEKIKDEFLANTSHELRTPIHGIIGISDSLVNGIAGDLSKIAKENLQLIVHSGKRLSNLVNDILDYSLLKNSDLKIVREPVNIKQIVDIVISVCKPLVGHNIIIKNQISNDIPAVVGDEDRLQQILFNLVGNAIKFTEEGEIIVSAKIEDDKIAVTVADTGEGFPSDKLDAIFEEFTQLDSSISRRFGGTGIGLSVTKKLIELHEGTISVTSTIGKGSQFTFILPTTGDKVETHNIEKRIDKISALQLEPVQETVTFERKPHSLDKDLFNVLVVDDDVVNCKVIFNFLSLYNYHVQIASSGREALRIIERGPKPNIVLLDLMMPDMTGFEVTEKIRVNHSLESLPIIILTAANSVRNFSMAIEMGANDYIIKPFNNEELHTRIGLHQKLHKINQELIIHKENLEIKVDQRTAEIRKLMENLEESRDIAIAANKTKSEFLANISHELRTPMHGLLGFAGLGKAQFDKNETEKLGEYLDEVIASGKRLLLLLNDLLDLSKLAANKFQFELREGRLMEIIQVVEIESSVLMSENGIKFEYGKKPEFDWVFIDNQRMTQVVRNILSNAIKFSNRDGKLIVDVVNENDDIIFSLTDNGIGIPENELESIFDEFVQSSNSKSGSGGTGLGLSISKRIIKAHKGKIWAETNPDGGTIMKFQLPLYENNKETINQ